MPHHRRRKQHNRLGCQDAPQQPEKAAFIRRFIGSGFETEIIFAHILKIPLAAYGKNAPVTLAAPATPIVESALLISLLTTLRLFSKYIVLFFNEWVLWITLLDTSIIAD